jgi:succinyl-CoA synthetase beta subunit
MNIHEYQAKHILRKYQIPCQDFRVVSRASDIEEAIDSLGVTEAVVKVQIHAGGRGKAGGVKIAKTREAIVQKANELLGMKIVTKQTGSEGVICHQVMISELADIAKEYYVGLLVDRAHAKPLLMVSPEGGTEIEEVAEKTPHKILKVHFSIDGSIDESALDSVCRFMDWTEKTSEAGKIFIKNLCRAFVENDGEMLEINPLIEDKEGDLWALDAKFSIDDNALFRRPEIKEMCDPSQSNSQEVIAHEMELAYIALEGNIGCMVNGAGLAMATMDLIKYHGGAPANFLDVGGGANKEKVAKSFGIILSDPNVKAILVNIFGGIMRCDVIAEGIIEAAKELHIKVPLVVRLEGTNVEKGKELLRKSGLTIIAADDLTDAAKKVVAHANSSK